MYDHSDIAARALASTSQARVALADLIAADPAVAARARQVLAKAGAELRAIGRDLRADKKAEARNGTPAGR